jgi:hypothetical protein
LESSLIRFGHYQQHHSFVSDFNQKAPVSSAVFSHTFPSQIASLFFLLSSESPFHFSFRTHFFTALEDASKGKMLLLQFADVEERGLQA